MTDKKISKEIMEGFLKQFFIERHKMEIERRVLQARALEGKLNDQVNAMLHAAKKECEIFDRKIKVCEDILKEIEKGDFSI